MRPGPAREAKLIGLKRDVRHSAAAEQAANGLAVTELQR